MNQIQVSQAVKDATAEIRCPVCESGKCQEFHLRGDEHTVVYLCNRRHFFDADGTAIVGDFPVCRHCGSVMVKDETYGHNIWVCACKP